MQLGNGVHTLDAYRPSFDPHSDIATVVFSHVQCVKTRASLAKVSKLWRDASKPTAAYPRFFDLEGLEGELADRLLRVLDVYRVRSLDKERALELIGVHQDRLCEYACVQRNFEVLKWARNELNLPLEPYPAEPVSDDVLVLRMLRTMCPELQKRWPVDTEPEEWVGVTMDRGRVVTLVLQGFGLTGAAEIGRLSALRQLILYDTQLTSVPAEIGQLTSLKWLDLGSNQLTSLPAEIGQLTALRELDLYNNQLTNLPAEIGQLMSLEKLELLNNKLTNLPAEIGQLASLEWLDLANNKLTSLPAEIGQLTALRGLYLNNNQLMCMPAEIGQLMSLTELYLNDNKLTSVPAEILQLTSLKELDLGQNQLTSVPAEVLQLTALTELSLHGNQLTSVPAEIWQLTSLRVLYLNDNKLMCGPAAICELRAAGCRVYLDDAVTYDIRSYTHAHG
jgi:leucine-rich repeat protein SHOC2